ncbi:MAG TPA: sigma-70 family RNA polymerase sigma factor [Saprospiraceae bacterium]|nr:sigma-70 family RNA polymerase sigma factor [Saprospiraceae bacterium]HMP26083.1 sigma-70 family RNA polymerase sigma factor [Saprospiraceae bacterium]
MMTETDANQELTTWVHLYARDLYYWALQKVSDSGLAEDLVQETFLVAAEKMHTFQQRSQPRTWLLGILKHKIADHYRATLQKVPTLSLSPEDLSAFFGANDRWRKETRPEAWDAQEELMDNQAFILVFEECLNKLSAMMNACIRLKFLAEKKAAEICQELGVSSTNYWQLLHRAKLQLRACLEQSWFRH